MMPAPPDWFDRDPLAAIIWRRAWEHAVALGHWEDVDVPGLRHLAMVVSTYIRLAREARAGQPPHEDLAEYRRHAREMLVEWSLLPPARVGLSSLRADGVDTDIGRALGLADEPSAA
jgi:hypothetical protein